MIKELLCEYLSFVIETNKNQINTHENPMNRSVKIINHAEKNETQKIIDSISAIFESGRDCKLNPKLFKELNKELKVVSEYLKCSQKEAFFFSIITTMNLYGDQVDLSDLCRFLDASPFNLMPEIKHIDELADKKIILRRPQRHRGTDIMRMNYYVASPDIIEALINGVDCPEQASRIHSGTFDVLETLFVLASECIEGNISDRDMIKEMKIILNENQKFAFIHHISTIQMLEVDRMILVFAVWKTLSGSTPVDLDQAIEHFNGAPARRIRYIQSMFSGENALIKNQLIEVKPARFFSDIEIEITPKTGEMLKADGIKMFKTKKKGNIIDPREIIEKKLYYNKEENTQITMLGDMIADENYGQLLERLKSKGLPLSLNVLLYGAPGTGKTETVLQLAKSSNREIMKVEISQTKSMWFGESEKLIKKIFKDYEEMMANSKTTPILLFNEADAILGKRRTNANSSTAQTENAIQNILLEELENFKGIFMATTNLADNLDRAFDRRFLFKVFFSTPDVIAKNSIWKQKMPHLEDSETMKLAELFNLTGGQIDNVVRKCEINSVIKGGYPEFEALLNYCREETTLNKGSKNTIGFIQ